MPYKIHESIITLDRLVFDLIRFGIQQIIKYNLLKYFVNNLINKLLFSTNYVLVN